MAIIAGIAAGDMGWMFASRSDAVMTGATGAYYLCVIDGKGGRPNIRRVAVFANVGGLYMCRGLAGGVGAVVAVDAVTRDVGVVEVGRQPARRRMTVIAGVAAGDVSRLFARRGDTVMTGAAAAQNLCVIDGKRGRPNVRCVAVLANIAGLYVCRGLAGGLRAVVAAHTIASDVDVVEVSRQPGNG